MTFENLKIITHDSVCEMMSVYNPANTEPKNNVVATLENNSSLQKPRYTFLKVSSRKPNIQSYPKVFYRLVTSNIFKVLLTFWEPKTNVY